LALVLGPEGVGRFGDSNRIFPDQTFAVWHALPGLLINVMSASLLLCEQLPAPRKIWRISGSHVIMAGIMSAGQFAVAGLLVWAVLEPGFDFSDRGGARSSPRFQSLSLLRWVFQSSRSWPLS
jgi:glutamate:Na+ symporter, ESS family